MASYNKITLVGRMVRDPEIKHTQGGLAVASFTIAVDRFGKDPVSGEKKTDFFRCKAWRQKAEFVEKYVRQGRLVLVDGRVELNDFVGQDGVKKYVTEVVCDQVETLDQPRDGAGEAAPAAGYGGGNRGNYGGGAPAGGASANDGGGYYPDEELAAPRSAAPRNSAQAAQSRPAPAPRAAPAAQAPPAAAKAAYPEDDFDDSDPFADE